MIDWIVQHSADFIAKGKRFFRQEALERHGQPDRIEQFHQRIKHLVRLIAGKEANLFGLLLYRASKLGVVSGHGIFHISREPFDGYEARMSRTALPKTRGGNVGCQHIRVS
jgi:hypothetical protein